MDVEKRKGLAPIPHPINFFLSPAQIHAIKVLRQFGWQLVCLRREGLQDIMPVLWNKTERCPGALDHKGSLRVGHEIRIRSRQCRSSNEPPSN